MELSRRQWLGGAAVALATAPQFKVLAAPKPIVVTPEKFGAAGDGVTNDTAAFAKMAEFIGHHGGAQIVLRPTTYIVGKQSNSGAFNAYTYAFAPQPILTLDGCTGPIIIQGNGAKLRCADGLRFGTFDPVTGQPTSHQLPYTQWGEQAAPYEAMIKIQNCTGDVYIENLELDGNVSALKIGGPYGDTGWQLPGDGIELLNNVGNEQIVHVYSHHHPRDGLLIIGAAERSTSSTIKDITSEYNARQGCSLVGGKNYSFQNCRFNHTGRAGLMSAPASGVDLEAEDSPIRAISFSGCEFSNNAGIGLVADSGDTEGATFDSCRFIGTTGWSAWPKKPAFRFSNCQFVGAVVHPFSDPDPARAAQFTNCEFLDDPSLSPTGEVYAPGQPCVNMAESHNILFDSCRFELKFASLLPWSWYAHYNNCTMSQTSAVDSHPAGTYTGVCTINGNVDLYGIVVAGDVTINGQLMPRTA
jgi:hypothetical protein